MIVNANEKATNHTKAKPDEKIPISITMEFCRIEKPLGTILKFKQQLTFRICLIYKWAQEELYPMSCLRLSGRIQNAPGRIVALIDMGNLYMG